MCNFPRLAIVVSHEKSNEDEGSLFVEMTNGYSSMEIRSFEAALSMLPSGSRVQVVAKGTVGNNTVHHLSRIIHRCNVLVSLDLTDVTEWSRVYDSPFQGNQNLLYMRFPSNLVSINPRAFADCTALEAVSIPSTCVLIGAEAFKGCEKLTRIEFADAANWYYEADDGSAQPMQGLHDATEAPLLLSRRNAKFATCRLFKSSLQAELTAAQRRDASAV